MAYQVTPARPGWYRIRAMISRARIQTAVLTHGWLCRALTAGVFPPGDSAI